MKRRYKSAETTCKIKNFSIGAFSRTRLNDDVRGERGMSRTRYRTTNSVQDRTHRPSCFLSSHGCQMRLPHREEESISLWSDWRMDIAPELRRSFVSMGREERKNPFVPGRVFHPRVSLSIKEEEGV